jgi:hypothetical protein
MKQTKPDQRRNVPSIPTILIAVLASLMCWSSQPAGAAVPEVSGQYAIQVIEPPPDTTEVWFTFINENGMVVMQYFVEPPEGSAQGHTAILENGVWTVIDVPGSAWCGASYPNGSGRIGMVYALADDPTGYQHNTIYFRGNYTPVPDHPEWQFAIQEINDHGIMTGYSFIEDWFDGNIWIGDHGLLLNADLSLFQVFDPPGSIETLPLGINNAGLLVGVYWDQQKVGHGFFSVRGETFKDLDVPGALGTTAIDINNKGEIVGNFRDSSNFRRGFLLRNGVFASFTVPNSTKTSIERITDSGTISGNFVAQDGKPYGYVARRIAGRK